MMRTLWLSAALAACGDNALGPAPASDDGSLVPSYRVDGMPSDGPPPIACDTRFTAPAGVFDCPNVMVGGDPLHWLRTCPAGIGKVAALTSETWFDEVGRNVRQLDVFEPATNIQTWDSTTVYDDVGEKEFTIRDGHGKLVQHYVIASRSAAGNPLEATLDWDPIGTDPASAHVIATFTYDGYDRLVDATYGFIDGVLMLDRGISYDEAARRRVDANYFAQFPGAGPASTSYVDEDVDALGRLVAITIVPNENNAGSVEQMTYDEMGRLSRTVTTSSDGVQTTDTFYECE